MIESQEYPRSQVRAVFHSEKVEFVSLEQGANLITLTPEDCMSIMMRQLEMRKLRGLPPPEPGLDAQQEGYQG